MASSRSVAERLSAVLNETNQVLVPLVEEYGVNGSHVGHYGNPEGTDYPIFPDVSSFSENHPNAPGAGFLAILDLLRAQSLVIANQAQRIENLEQSVNSINHYSTGERFDHSECPSDACLTDEFVDNALAEALGIEPRGAVKIEKDRQVEIARKEAERIEAERQAKVKAEFERQQAILEAQRLQAEREAQEREQESERLRKAYELEMSLEEERLRGL